MAIGDTLRGIGKRTAQGIVGKQLRRVAGNVASLIGGPNRSNSSDLAGINRTKAATNVLSFPIDINNVDPGTGGNHGHYIMFFINEQTNSTFLIPKNSFVSFPIDTKNGFISTPITFFKKLDKCKHTKPQLQPISNSVFSLERYFSIPYLSILFSVGLQP